MLLSFKPLRTAALAFSVLSLPLSTSHAAHAYAGLLDTNGTTGFGPGDRLAFVNQTTGAAITGDSFGVQTMSLVSVGNQTGLYLSTGISFTALQRSANVWTGSAYMPAKAFGASAGAYLELRIGAVTGPNGAHFSFWDDGSTSATFTLSTGIVGGTSAFLLTNDGVSYPDQPVYIGDGVTPNPTAPNGIPPADPYGHIHGRSVTVDQPGTYTVTYVIHDRSGLQQDSEPFTVSYSAVPEPSTVALVGGASLLCGFIRRRSHRATSSR